jgi:hypothetical protein
MDWFCLAPDANDSAESLGSIESQELLENLNDYQVQTQNFSMGERWGLNLRPHIIYVWV